MLGGLVLLVILCCHTFGGIVIERRLGLGLTSIVLVDCSLHPQSERIEGQSMG